MVRKTIKHGTKLPVYFTEKELKLIQDETFYDGFGKIGLVEKGKIKIMLSLDDIEELQGYIAAEANHTENKKVQRELDKVFGKLQVFLDTYDDQDEFNN